MTDDTRFPPGFLWGVATSAYQIEGSPLADGAGVSIWHRFAHTPGNVVNDENGDVACDHYNRYRGDVELMKEIGLTGYHFSTYAIFPTALVLTTVLVGVLRASYDVLTKDIFRVAGLRRRAILVGQR